jgi:hypothetical protein
MLRKLLSSVAINKEILLLAEKQIEHRMFSMEDMIKDISKIRPQKVRNGKLSINTVSETFL